MSEVTLMQRRTFGPDTVLDKYGLGPIEVGSGAQPAARQAVNNLNNVEFGELPQHEQRMKDHAQTLAAVQAEHVKAINDAQAAVAVRESKPASDVTQAEINSQLESTLDPRHSLIRAARISAVMAKEHADLVAKIKAAKEAMIADGLIAKPAK
jgi:hypothetical protein